MKDIKVVVDKMARNGRKTAIAEGRWWQLQETMILASLILGCLCIWSSKYFFSIFLMINLFDIEVMWLSLHKRYNLYLILHNLSQILENPFYKNWDRLKLACINQMIFGIKIRKIFHPNPIEQWKIDFETQPVRLYPYIL